MDRHEPQSGSEEPPERFISHILRLRGYAMLGNNSHRDRIPSLRHPKYDPIPLVLMAKDLGAAGIISEISTAFKGARHRVWMTRTQRQRAHDTYVEVIGAQVGRDSEGSPVYDGSAYKALLSVSRQLDEELRKMASPVTLAIASEKLNFSTANGFYDPENGATFASPPFLRPPVQAERTWSVADGRNWEKVGDALNEIGGMGPVKHLVRIDPRRKSALATVDDGQSDTVPMYQCGMRGVWREVETLPRHTYERWLDGSWDEFDKNADLITRPPRSVPNPTYLNCAAFTDKILGNLSQARKNAFPEHAPKILVPDMKQEQAF